MTPSDLFDLLSPEKQNFLLVTHKFPDHDAIGSLLSMAQMLKKQGHTVKCWVPEFDEREFGWLPGKELISEQLGFFVGSSDLGTGTSKDTYDFVISLDASNFDRIPNNEQLIPVLKNVPLINIDHHMDNSHYGAYNYVVDLSSVGEVLFQLFFSWGWDVDASVATCLYAAICTDTGRFLFDNTTGATLIAAGALINKGADRHLVSRKIYESKSQTDFSILLLALKNLVVNESLSYGYSFLPFPSPDSKAKPIDFIRQCADIDIALVFQEIEQDVIKISLRSKESFDVQLFSAQFGGGGHKKASGIMLKGSLDDVIQRVINALESSINSI
ncbi:hypothetical protein HOG98_04545 [bacterium]|jgi:bifunctional oligoribonuclease and PAP phosphatase NrnA|nr:hypothetical protein [bacterium]